MKATSTNLPSNVQNIGVGLSDIKPAVAPDVISIAASTTQGYTQLANLVEGVTYRFFLSNAETTNHGDGAWANASQFIATGTTSEEFGSGGALYVHIRVDATDKQPNSEIKSIAVMFKQ